MRKVELDGLVRQVPGSWDELDAAQLTRITVARMLPDAQLRRLTITMVLLNVHWLRDVRMWWRFHRLNGKEKAALMVLADPFIDEQPMQLMVMDRLKAGRATLHLQCSPRLLDSLSAEAWGEADSHFLRWMEHGKVQNLQHMAAVLYSKSASTLEQRRDGISMRATQRVPVRQLLAMACNWSALRQVLVRSCPHVFTTGRQKGAQNTGWNNVLLSMSGAKFGSYATTKDTPVRPFMVELNQRICDDKNAQHRANRGLK